MDWTETCLRMEYAFEKLTISDISVFLLNVVLTSVFCLCREGARYKACVVLILAATDWLSVTLEAAFTALYASSGDTVTSGDFYETTCPRMLLQTGELSFP